MKSTHLYRLPCRLLPAITALMVPLLTANAAVKLEPLWELPAGEDTSIFPSHGSPTTLNSLERGLAYNPVSGNVLVASRSGGPQIHVLDKDRTNTEGDPENEIRQLDLGLGLEEPPFLTFGVTFAVNLVGVASDGVVYACNLISSGTQSDNFRIYRWDSDAPDTPETPNTPTVAFAGNPDPSATIVRWGDTMAVRGSGNDTQILLGTNTAGVLSVAVLTTEDGGLTFNTTLIPGALQGSSTRGLTWGPPGENSFYSKANGPSNPIRKTTFTLEPTVTATVDTVITSTVATGQTGPMYFDPASNRMAVLDLTVNGLFTGPGGLENTFTDTDYIKLYDVDPVTGAVVASPELASTALTGSAGNGNIAGAVAIGDNKVFVCSTNKGIQAFSIVDDQTVEPTTATVSPATAAVWTRGQLTLSATTTGTPPITLQWLKDEVPLEGETGLTLTINPVTEAAAGIYKVRATNAAGSNDSAGTTVTTPASTDTGVLTKQWEIVPGSRPWMTTGDTERGMAVNPDKGRVYVVSRAAGALSVQVLNAADGTGAGTLDITDVTGGLVGIALNTIGVADDGAIYACNLSDGNTELKIYRWVDDDPSTIPEVVYAGIPAFTRMGDSMDVRGSGENTEIVIGGRLPNYIIIKQINGEWIATSIDFTGLPTNTFALGVAFGSGNEVWGKSVGTAPQGDPPVTLPLPLVRTSYNLENISGEVLTTAPAEQILTTSIGFAYDPANALIGISGLELSDSVRLYKVTDPAAGTLELLDQEFYSTDNANINGVGSATFAGGRLYTLNTNNGLIAFNIALAPAPAGDAILSDPVRAGGNFTFSLTGTQGATYLIQRSPDLAVWTDDGTVTLTNGTTTTVTRPAAGERLYFRARGQ